MTTADARKGHEVGCRTAHHEPRAAQRGPLPDDPARVVARRPIRLEGALVLLVDDDQPQVAQRREGRHARAQHDPRLAAQHAPPRVVTLARRQARVHDHQVAAHQRGQPVTELGNERDLGNEDERRPAGGQGASMAAR